MEHKVEIVGEFRIAPPPGSLPTTLLPLSVFDFPALMFNNIYTFKRLFFYAYPQTLHQFTQTIIPSLKSSLSITLQHFYPLVSNLILTPPPGKPYFQFTEGNYVSFTVAQYSGDFDYVSSNQIKEVRLLHSFAPELPSTRVSPDGTSVDFLLAVQITLFPDQGICIGVGFNHTVADGRTLHYFMKSWASVCRSNGVVEIDKFLMPSFDRDSIEDPYQTESKLLKMWHEHDSSSKEGEILTHDDRVRSTFVLKRSQLEKLKQSISNNYGIVHLTSFIVTCSFVWGCLIKSQESSTDNEGKDKVCRILVPVDLRNRIKRIPMTYFGNCLTFIHADVKRSELMEQNGIFFAARAIENCIKEFECTGAWRTIDNWALPFDQQAFKSCILLSVAGSPKFDVYKTDFGWGLPNIAEALHIGSRNSISLAECRDGDGGIEIGLELKRKEMEAFTQHFMMLETSKFEQDLLK
jgi:hypothetical protein